MKAFIRYMYVVLILLFINIAIFPGYAQSFSRIDSSKTSKVINVIIDDSTSMVFDDYTKENGKKKPVTRWIEADYALKALAAMMDDGDVLTIYRMGDPNALGNITIGEGDTVKKIDEQLKNIKIVNETSFRNVKTAAENLSEEYRSDKQKEYWVVVLADGYFTSPAPFSRAGNADQKEKEFNNQMKELVKTEGVHFAYIPIGEQVSKLDNALISEVVQPRNTNSGTGNSTHTSIQEQVVDVINQIYNRVELPQETVNEKKYLEKDQEGETIRVDVPIGKIIYFSQDNKGPLNKKDYENEQSNQEFITVDAAPAGFSQLPDISFTGRKEFPGFDSSITQKGYHDRLNEIQYYSLKGIVYKWEKTTDYNAADALNDETLIRIKTGQVKNVLSTVYYQPDVNVLIEYFQNGKPVVHMEGCSYKDFSTEQEEGCLHAGEINVKLRIVNDKGEDIQNPDSPLLYPDRFEITLVSSGENREKVQGINQNDMEQTYQLEEGQYDLKVMTPWHEEITRRLNIQEERKELSLDLTEKEIPVDLPDEQSAALHVQVKEAGYPLSPGTACSISVTHDSADSTKLLIEDEQMTGAGEWKIPVKLADHLQHNISKTATFHIEAKREYDTGGPESVQKDFTLSLTSSPPELEIKLGQPWATRYYRRIYEGERIPLIVLCDEQELTDEQRKNAIIRKVDVRPEKLDSLIDIDETDNALKLKKGLSWILPGTDTAEIVLNVEYERWNSSSSIESDTLELQIEYIPFGILAAVLILLLLLLLWIILIIVKRWSFCFIPKFKAVLQTENGVTTKNVQLYRKRLLVLPFFKTAYLCYTQPKEYPNPLLRSFRMKFQRNRIINGWKICNYVDFSDGDRYRINGIPITEDNCTFSSDLKFSVKNRNGNWMELIIQ